MPLFDKKRSVMALDSRAIALIKQELSSVLSIAASYDHMMEQNGEYVISLEGRMRGDLLAFTLYLSGFGGKTKPEEITVVNKIFDIDLSNADFVLFRKDVGNKSFQHAVPPSILILHELGNRIQNEGTNADGPSASQVAERNGVPNMAKALTDALINVYALIGSALTSADSVITKRESTELIQYLYMMVRAIDGPNAQLPEGPARSTIAAHKRLFDKEPRIS
ncbi:MAG: hypothetical protein Q4A01_07340 [Coriobacteriales bacterium]|nr:hypothetical protein [Coriobacteriales bacterium]